MKEQIAESLKEIESLIMDEFLWKDDPTPDNIIKVYEIITKTLNLTKKWKPSQSPIEN